MQNAIILSKKFILSLMCEITAVQSLVERRKIILKHKCVSRRKNNKHKTSHPSSPLSMEGHRSLASTPS